MSKKPDDKINGPGRTIRRTIADGEPLKINGLILEVRRKRRHRGQYRVIVRLNDGDQGSQGDSQGGRPAA